MDEPSSNSSANLQDQRLKALTPIQNSQLNILEFKDQYLRAAQADFRKHSDKAKIKENPLLLDNSISKYKELFENRKIIYLEHETRHSFVESIIKDPPSFVEQWEIQDLIGRNKSKKTELKDLKSRNNQISKDLEFKAREVANGYEQIIKDQKEAEDLEAEIKRLEDELQQVEQELTDSQLPVSEDPDLNVPFDQLVSREIENQALQVELDAQLSQAASELPNLANNLDDLEQEVQELEQTSQRLQHQVQQMEQTREEQRTQETRALESAMDSYKNYNSILLSIGRLENFKVEVVSPCVEKLSFTKDGRRYEIHVNSVTSQVMEAKVQNIPSVTVEMIIAKTATINSNWNLTTFMMEIQKLLNS